MSNRIPGTNPNGRCYKATILHGSKATIRIGGREVQSILHKY